MMMKGFKVYQIDSSTRPVRACSRRDWCTIYLLTGQHRALSADQAVEQEGTCLSFGSPPGLNSPEWVLTRQIGYACWFTDEFVRESGQADIQASWSFLHGDQAAVFWLCDEQAAYLTGVFEQMLAEQQTAYRFKHELVRSYLQLIFHAALRLHFPAPKRGFGYYFRRPGPGGLLDFGWRSRQRPFGELPE